MGGWVRGSKGCENGQQEEGQRQQFCQAVVEVVTATVDLHAVVCAARGRQGCAEEGG